MPYFTSENLSALKPIKVEQFWTEQTLLRVTRVIPQHLLKLDVTSRFSPSAFGDEMVLELTAYIQKKDKALDVPLAWWDHFKLTHFPSWLLKRFPAKYRTIDVRTLFPHLPAEITDKAHCYTYLKKEE